MLDFLERFEKLNECSPVWRERVLNKFTLICFIDKPGVVESSRVFTKRFLICVQQFCDAF